MALDSLLSERKSRKPDLIASVVLFFISGSFFIQNILLIKECPAEDWLPICLLSKKSFNYDTVDTRYCELLYTE